MTSIFLLILLSQSPVESRLYKGSIMGSATAAIMDMTTTGYCIGAKTCIEKNPILAPFSDSPAAMGAVKGLLHSSVILLIHELVWKKGHRILAIVMNGVNTAIITYVAIRNERIGK